MKPTQKKSMRVVALVWVVSIVAGLVAYVAVLSPQQKKLADMKRTLEQKKQAYDDAVEQTSPQNRAKLEKRLDGLRGQLGMFAVGPEKSANLTFDISTLARDNELGAFNVQNNPNREEKMPDAPTLHENFIDVEFEGSFLQFARFLNSLERNTPVLFIDSFSLEKSRDNPSANKVSMDLAALVKRVEKDS